MKQSLQIHAPVWASLPLSILLIVSPHMTCAGEELDARWSRCPGADVRVKAADPRDAKDACQGAAVAVAFLSRAGVAQREPASIEVMTRLPAGAGETAAGCYALRLRQANVLGYEHFRKCRTWFKVPIDRRLYRSLVTHEAAHAVAAGHFEKQPPPVHAAEYVAYVVMIASMPASLRQRILRALPGQGFDSGQQITPIHYLFDPMSFGAESCRHCLKPGNGDRFLRAVLSGQELAD